APAPVRFSVAEAVPPAPPLAVLVAPRLSPPGPAIGVAVASHRARLRGVYRIVKGQARGRRPPGAARRRGAIATPAAGGRLVQSHGAAAGRTGHGVGQGAGSAL